MVKRGTIHVTMNEDINVSTHAKVECHIKNVSFIIPAHTEALQQKKSESTGTSLDLLSLFTFDSVYSVPKFRH